MKLAAPHAFFPGGLDTAGRRLAFALAASLALHALTLALNPRLPRGGSSLPFAATLSVTLTDLKSEPRLAQSERVDPGQGGGNAERPGHAESARLAQERLAHAVTQRSATRLNLEQSEELSLPTGRRVAVEGERALIRAARQAQSESAAGEAARGGDDCRIAGFWFCSSL